MLLALTLAPLCGCSIRRMAINSLADTLAASGDVYASDDDPELVRDAVPFALKTIESLLAEVPEHRGLLLAACQGFAQYAYAFVVTDARMLEFTDYSASAELEQRARRMYLRARDYCLRSLELDHPGIKEQLMTDPEGAVTAIAADEVELAYWTGASWGGAISLGKDRPELVADLPAVVALMHRALELDEAFGEGAIYEVLITLDSLPENMGGSLERARHDFRRAVELSRGLRASPYVSLAANVAVAEQDRQEFRRLLEQALEVDPDADPGSRLQNLIGQKRARQMLAVIDELFLDTDLEPEGSTR